MKLRNPFTTLVLFLLIVAPAFNPRVLAGFEVQDKSKHKTEKEKPRVVTGDEGHPVLWSDPANIETLDLFYGSGGSEGAPDPGGKFTYVDAVTRGTQHVFGIRNDRGD